MKKIFIATPISGFNNWSEYDTFRINVLKLIDKLKQQNYSIWSEIETIDSASEYDTPEQSVEKDMKNIMKSDIFLFIHPRRMQTSTLFELGFAFSLSKKIIIVGEEKDLPYMVKGLSINGQYLRIINSCVLDESTINKIIREINAIPVP